MSVHITSWAWKQKVKDAGAKLVLLKLADSANDEGICWPSKRLLAEECEMSKRTIRYKIEALTKAGFIGIEERLRENRSTSSNLYRILAPVQYLHPTVQDLHGEGASVDTPPVQGAAPPESSLEPSNEKGQSSGDEKSAPTLEVRRWIKRWAPTMSEKAAIDILDGHFGLRDERLVAALALFNKQKKEAA